MQCIFFEVEVCCHEGDLMSYWNWLQWVSKLNPRRGFAGVCGRGEGCVCEVCVCGKEGKGVN
jgi:hypothetical protein